MSIINTIESQINTNSSKRRNKATGIFNIKKIKNQKKWTREEDELLVNLVVMYNEKNWKEIAKKFNNKNSLQCFSRYKRIRPGIVKGSWKKEEDFKILELVKKYGKAWSKISKILGTRNGKQIRDRFINVLDPEIKKGKFTEEEDNKLILLFREYGPRWATISKYYPNRTADMVKNRFHSSIKKKISTNGLENAIDMKDSEFTISNIQEKSNVNCKLNRKITNTTISGKTLHTSESYSKSYSPRESLALQNIEINENKSSSSSYKERESNFYTQTANNLNCDYFNFEKGIKIEDAIYGEGSFNWIFEDYFTV